MIYTIICKFVRNNAFRIWRKYGNVNGIYKSHTWNMAILSVKQRTLQLFIWISLASISSLTCIVNYTSKYLNYKHIIQNRD